MTTITLEENVLVPNRQKIRALREARGWTLDDAFASARTRKLKLSKGTLRTLESEAAAAGCRLSTLGEVLRLYGLPRTDLLVLVMDDPDETEEPLPPARPKRVPKSRRSA